MNTELNQTWLPHIECLNVNCNVRPKSKPIPIRKGQRGSHAWLLIKIHRAVKLWNDTNLSFKNEGFELDLQKIADDFKSGKIGLKGYDQS
jgi:hypothetical protein